MFIKFFQSIFKLLVTNLCKDITSKFFKLSQLKEEIKNKSKMLHPLIHYTPTNHIFQTNAAEKISIHHFAIYEDM